MKPSHSFRRGLLASALAVPTLAERTWAQASALPPQTAPVAGGGVGGALLLVGVIGALLVLIGITVKMYDLKRQREEEGVALQARISDALMMDPSLAGLALTPTVRIPFRRGLSGAVTVTGVAPTPQLREAAIQLVMREVTHAGARVHIEDRIAVDTMLARHAA
ncbi:MAG: hypothetical protein HYY95_09440 [Candidatus Rokubacteria bacterium]|nr:hypothetical protein [Candidatus Rokubacteria bacterium]MBI3105776.1 hypothetical protein [Candidatus Rokubacteria bacterium]